MVAFLLKKKYNAVFPKHVHKTLNFVIKHIVCNVQLLMDFFLF